MDIGVFWMVCWLSTELVEYMHVLSYSGQKHAVFYVSIMVCAAEITNLMCMPYFPCTGHKFNFPLRMPYIHYTDET